LTPDIWKAVRYGLILVLALMMLLFIVRPLVKAVTQAAPAKVEEAQVEKEDVEAGVAKANSDYEGADAVSAVSAPQHRLMSVEYASENPRKTAQILRVWLLEDAESSPTLGELASDGSEKTAERAGA